jgi:predicted TIM-barrel fold metal-dependent hydrolase
MSNIDFLQTTSEIINTSNIDFLQTTSEIINTSNIDFLQTTSQNINLKDMPNKLKEAYINSLRERRNKLLDETDKYMITDFPISEENKNIIMKYRQELRDFMNLDIVKIENLSDKTMEYFPKKPYFNK